MNNKKERIIGLDIVRTIAIFFVISVHFFLNIGFYDQIIAGETDFILIFVRETFYICVPLFLLLTGYLCNDKKLSNHYFIKIVKILISFIIAGIICLLFRKLYLKESISLLQGIVSLLNFTASPNGWYVEMYVGLFFFIPFLNIIYRNLKTKSDKRKLIYILLFFTSLNSIINNISIFNTTIDIVPNYWIIVYPITYYFIGSYLKEYPLIYQKKKLVVLLLLVLLFQTIGIYCYNYNNTFNWNFFNGYNGILTVIISVLVFSIFYNLDIKSKLPKRIIKKISLCSFEMYLISYVFDCIIYSKVHTPTDLIGYCKLYFICVSLSFICSFIFAYIINYISSKIYNKIVFKTKKTDAIDN